MKQSREEVSESDPWREKSAVITDQEVSFFFEDSFTNSTFSEVQRTLKPYVPLDDSKQYLAGLERKLAKLQGKTTSLRENERKRLIDALAKSKDDHAIDLIKNDEITVGKETESLENDGQNRTLSSFTSVDPQGTLGYMMRKCAPEHVALSTEELCELLKADILSKVHDEIESEEATNETEDKIDNAELASTEDDEHNNH